MENRILTRRFRSVAGDLILGSYMDKLCLCDWAESPKHDSAIGRLIRFTHAEITEGDNNCLHVRRSNSMNISTVVAQCSGFRYIYAEQNSRDGYGKFC